MKLLHIGLCVQPFPFNGFQTPFIDVLGQENYKELSCGINGLDNTSKEIFDQFKPDIVFLQIQAPNIISSRTIKHFHDNGAKVINWTGDVRDSVPHWMVECAPYCISSFSNMNDVNSMRAKGFKSEYLEIGYDPEIYNPQGDSANVAPIVFMANNYGSQFPLSRYRSDLAKRLQGSFGNQFALYGNGWTNANGNVNTSQREEARHYRGAKIAINCSHFNYERYSSDRLLRILGSGTFCLTHNYTGIEQDYESGKHLVTFNDLVDLESKIKYYLYHDEERIAIANQGQQLVLNRNTFKHQVQNILSL